MKFLIELWEHQKKALGLALDSLVDKNSKGFALFMEMGTGKTATTVNIIRALFGLRKRVLRTIIFCPPVVRENWKREFAMHSKIDPKKIIVLEGSGTRRANTFKQHAFGATSDPLETTVNVEGKIFITNYESLSMKPLFNLMMGWDAEILIFDESHKLKSHKAKRTLLAIKLADRARHKILLTGTPILNNAMDIWSQFRILDGGETFDKNFFAFRARYFVDRNAGMPSTKYFPDYRPIPGLEKMFNRLIYNKAFRVMKEECLDLPPIVRKRIDVDMSAEQRKMYNDMAKSYVAYLGDKACVASIALTRALRLQQIASGHFVDDTQEVHKFKSNPRLDALSEILEGLFQQHKIIVWSAFKQNYKEILGVCEKLGAPATILTGGMTDKQRQKSIDDFQEDPSIRILVANQQAGGTGVNLTAASFMVYYSKGFGLEADSQSEARAHRGGSEVHKSITRIDLVAPNTIDQVITEALARKENLAKNILRLKDLL